MTEAAGLVRIGAEIAADRVVRTPGRAPEKGIRERQELAPAFEVGLAEACEKLGHSVARIDSDRVLGGLANWNRPSSQVDLVVEGLSGDVELVGELEAWDIDHQIFDLVKVCCLIDGVGASGFLACVARRSGDFERLPGGELFPAEDGEPRVHDLPELFSRHARSVARHFGHGGPKPIAMPRSVRTTAVSDPVPIRAYEGHELRVCLVEPLGEDRLSLTDVLTEQRVDSDPFDRGAA